MFRRQSRQTGGSPWSQQGALGADAPGEGGWTAACAAWLEALNKVGPYNSVTISITTLMPIKMARGLITFVHTLPPKQFSSTDHLSLLQVWSAQVFSSAAALGCSRWFPSLRMPSSYAAQSTPISAATIL